jgi:protein involved in polysaccharide export with SLBB domain
VGAQVAVSGSVDNPAIYELKATSTLGEVLRLAGGLSPLAAIHQAVLERIDAGTSLKTSEVSLDATGLATAVQNGDILRVQDVVARFDNAVTLRGNVAVPRRFAWHEGIKISDLIPNKEALLTRDYWRERNSLINLEPDDDLKPSSSTSLADLSSSNAPPGTSPGPSSAGRFTRVQVENAGSDRSLGSVQAGSAGITVRKFDVRNQVQPPAPDINWDYAVVERLDSATLSTRLIPFNLAEVVLNHNALQDHSLEPGDVVTIFSKADISVPVDRRAKYVRVEGEVGGAGIYSVNPSETLRDLVKRAGGFTPGAYLYGLQFTRESTQREQQQRFDTFLDSLEVQINQGAANQAGRVLSPDQGTLAQASLASQRTLVQKLRETPATGRIVLDLDYKSSSVEDLPELPLEDGDRIYIPNRPSTVNVVGTVNNQGSFVYSKDFRLGDYLDLAGGASRFADQSHMFVIRADGSVVSKTAAGSIFARNIESLRMFPGDTLVVPTYVNKSTFLRGLTDWSQVVANFALGAAAVNLLK